MSFSRDPGGSGIRQLSFAKKYWQITSRQLSDEIRRSNTEENNGFGKDEGK